MSMWELFEKKGNISLTDQPVEFHVEIRILIVDARCTPKCGTGCGGGVNSIRCRLAVLTVDFIVHLLEGTW